MKFLANENFPADSVKYLKDRGYDVWSIGVDYKGVSDREVLELAQKEQRTILTFDRDYGELIFKYHFKPEKGVIYLRLDEYESDEPGKIIERLISNPSFETLSKLTVFNGQMIRQRSY